MKIDMHLHLLPAIDDGAKDEKIVLELVERLKKQGIDEICLTPHFFSNHDQLFEFVAQRKASLEKVKHIFNQEKIKVRLGSEVLLSRNIFSNESLEELCFENTRYMLVEIPTSIKKQKTLEQHINKLFANYSITPIIAHVERYRWLFNYKGLVWLNDIGCRVQFDNAALLKRRDRKKILQFIDLGLIHLCGSDAHDLEKRTANFDLLDEYLTDEQKEYLFDNAQELFYK